MTLNHFSRKHNIDQYPNIMIHKVNLAWKIIIIKQNNNNNISSSQFLMKMVSLMIFYKATTIFVLVRAFYHNNKLFLSFSLSLFFSSIYLFLFLQSQNICPYCNSTLYALTKTQIVVVSKKSTNNKVKFVFAFANLDNHLQ